jgi:hypothetical protein
MEKKNVSLTNEVLAKKFKNNFELVNYAIQLAENMIHTGRDARVKSDMQNRAMLILQEINEGKDHFDVIPEAVERANENHFPRDAEEKKSRYAPEERTERRKSKFAFTDSDN